MFTRSGARRENIRVSDFDLEDDSDSGVRVVVSLFEDGIFVKVLDREYVSLCELVVLDMV